MGSEVQHCRAAYQRAMLVGVLTAESSTPSSSSISELIPGVICCCCDGFRLIADAAFTPLTIPLRFPTAPSPPPAFLYFPNKSSPPPTPPLPFSAPMSASSFCSSSGFHCVTASSALSDCMYRDWSGALQACGVGLGEVLEESEVRAGEVEEDEEEAVGLCVMEAAAAVTGGGLLAAMSVMSSSAPRAFCWLGLAPMAECGKRGQRGKAVLRRYPTDSRIAMIPLGDERMASWGIPWHCDRCGRWWSW